jgi:hypothetical protein
MIIKIKRRISTRTCCFPEFTFFILIAIFAERPLRIQNSLFAALAKNRSMKIAGTKIKDASRAAASISIMQQSAIRNGRCFGSWLAMGSFGNVNRPSAAVS